MNSKVNKFIVVIRRYLFAGLFVWVPIWVTLIILDFLIKIFDKTLYLLPNKYNPNNLFTMHIPGLGIIFALLLLLITGLIANNLFGKKLVKIWDNLIGRIPVVRTIYLGVKQVLEAIFSASGGSFKKVLLVEYPRKGIWSIAFQTSDNSDEYAAYIGEKTVTIFIPTTPNPTSGFLMIVPEKDVKVLNMSVDQALKTVISLGVMQPQAVEPNKIISSKYDQKK